MPSSPWTHCGVLLWKPPASQNCRTSLSQFVSACCWDPALIAKVMGRRLQSWPLFEESCLRSTGNMNQQISFGTYTEMAQCMATDSYSFVVIMKKLKVVCSKARPWHSWSCRTWKSCHKGSKLQRRPSWRPRSPILQRMKGKVLGNGHLLYGGCHHLYCWAWHWYQPASPDLAREKYLWRSF